MNIALVNPNIVTQKDDMFGTGIPYMPITLAYLASYLKKNGHSISVIDAFGENPFKIRRTKNLYIQGLDVEEIVRKIHKDVEFICIYAGLVVTHTVNLNILRAIKTGFNVPIVIIENTQSVIAYSLKMVYEEFLENGADYIIMGEPEYRVEKLIEIISNNKKEDLKKIDGLIYKVRNRVEINEKQSYISKPDNLPFPAWDLFPLENYWKLGYSHAPLSSKKYLSILTSRGCPYNCAFCIIPNTNEKRWRYRSPKNIVDEMIYWGEKFDVKEFHIEDLNPIILKSRMVEMSKLILKRKLNIKWKIAAGTKIEHIDKDTLKLMSRSGCNYISFSPESGSDYVLKLMNKSFDYKFGLKIVREMNKLKITSQACFVIGFPGETDKDLNETKKYIKKLTKSGLDEVAIFIMTPIPGSAQYGKLSGYKSLDQLTFTPTWREDFPFLNKFRKMIYINFIFWKLIYHPKKLLRQIFNFIFRNFETKSEMTIYRIFMLHF